MNCYLNLITILVFNLQLGFAQYYDSPKGNPIELGKVNWLRDYDIAIQQAKEKKLPIFILFQEVPGCSNCTKFGKDILSHPLVVEAIESHFIPLCIYNNTVGKDKSILEKFNEPAWNNPIVRIVNREGKDVVKRQADFRSMSNVVHTICDAIKSTNQSTPKYLELFLAEFQVNKSNIKGEAYFSMFCFWTGEKEIAGLNGIIATEAGFMNGKEVVHVIFDDSKTTLKEITNNAHKLGCADDVFAKVDKEVNSKPIGIFKKDKEDKYFLYHSKYKSIPMTEIQKTQVNRAIALQQDPKPFLSVKQLNILNINNSSKRNHLNDQIENVWWK